MIRLQRWESGPYFTAFSLHIPDMRVKIVKICPRSKSDRLLEPDHLQSFARCPSVRFHELLALFANYHGLFAVQEQL